MNKIKLMFWDKANFGDALSPYIIEKLSGNKIIKKDLYHGGMFCIRCLYGYLRRRKFKRLTFATWPWENNLMAIGSILEFANKKSIVWGSGFMKAESKYTDVGKILAVRGPLTATRVKELSNIECQTLGDPAILLPIIYQPNQQKRNKIGIIPHMIETDLFIKNYSFLDKNHFLIIDLRTRNIEYTIKQITSCRMVLSTSLHGIIVSHAYGIPAIWIKKNLNDGGFKFADYFMSVGISPYKGFTNIEEILSNKEYINNFFTENQDISLPKNNLVDLQKALLKVAPFKLLDKYINFINS